jgi:ABC-type Fe3+/spermidine/putrescine transport system ATPase subunit
MRRQLKDLQRRVGITTVFVTHDQVEALSLSDRIAIMNRGQLEQVGSPGEVYTCPATRFVQDFLGRTFTVPGRVVESQNGTVKVASGQEAESLLTCVPGGRFESGEFAAGREVVIAIRPEHIAILPSMSEQRPNVIAAKIRTALFIGNQFEYAVNVGDWTQVLPLSANKRYEVGTTIFLEFPESLTSVWPA